MYSTPNYKTTVAWKQIWTYYDNPGSEKFNVHTNPTLKFCCTLVIFYSSCMSRWWQCYNACSKNSASAFIVRQWCLKTCQPMLQWEWLRSLFIFIAVPQASNVLHTIHQPICSGVTSYCYILSSYRDWDGYRIGFVYCWALSKCRPLLPVQLPGVRCGLAQSGLIYLVFVLALKSIWRDKVLVRSYGIISLYSWSFIDTVDFFEVLGQYSLQ